MYCPQYFRTTQEYVGAFDGGPIGDDLELVECFPHDVADINFAQYEKDSDNEAFGVRQAGFNRAVTEPSIRNGFKSSRTATESDEIVDELFERFRLKATNNPAGARCDWRVLNMRVRRRPRRRDRSRRM